MAFVDVAIATGVALGAEGTGAALLGGAVLAGGAGAVAGGLYNGLTGRSVLNGALMGGAIGAIGGATAGYGLAGESAMIAADASTMAANGLSQAAISQNLMSSGYALTQAQADAAAAAALQGGSSAASTAAQAASAANTANSLNNAANVAPAAPVNAAGSNVAPAVTTPGVVPDVGNQYGILPGEGGNIGTLNGNVVYPDTNLTTPTINNTPTADELKALQAGGPQAGPTGGGGIGGMFGTIGKFVKEHPYLTAAGAGAAYLASRPNAFKPNYLSTYTPPTAKSYGLGATLGLNYRPTFAAAEGGIASLDKNFASGGMYPGSQIDHTQYSSSPQTPMSMQATMASYDPETNPLTGEPTTHMADGGVAQTPAVQPTAGGLTAAGITGLQQQQKPQSAQPITMGYIKSLADQYGVQLPSQLTTMGPGNTPGVAAAAKGGVMGQQYDLGSYSDGGRLLKGPGDGMSDNIPASIAGKQPARLADGEFVVPADVVSHLGNGSTDAGAKHLYKMMDNVRKARTGRKAQGKQIKADKFLPK
jgi:trimeric autotransporter adhesin